MDFEIKQKKKNLKQIKKILNKNLFVKHEKKKKKKTKNTKNKQKKNKFI